MKREDLTKITEKIIDSLYDGMRANTGDPRKYSTYNEREIALDYRDLVYALQEVELRTNARERRMGYMGIVENIRKKYKPQSFDDEVYYLADEFARPYNIFLRKDDPPYTSAIPENAKPDRVIQHYQAFIYLIFLELEHRLVMMEPNMNKNKKNKNMLAKGKPTIDTMERGEEQFLYTKLFRYAKDIKKRIDMVNKLQDEEKKLEKKCNHLSWVLNKVYEESGEFVKLCGNLPPEEYTFLLESCCFEEKEVESLDSFVDMILQEKKREEEDDYYSTWLQHKTGKHYKSLLVLYILVHKIKQELEESSSLLESANYHPGKPKKERVGNIINMSNGGSYVDVYGNGNVTLNINKETVKADNGDVSSGSIARQNKDSKSEIPHFGLDAKQLAHWADVYSHLVTAGMIKKSEVSSENFTWLLCGEGTAPFKPIRWYGSTRALAYMVRTQLNSKWEVATISFKDNKNKELPKSFKTTKDPSLKSKEKINQIFHT